MDEKPRTLAQNRAAHLWFEYLAQELNDAGLTVTKTLKADADIPWTKETVKELLFKQIMNLMYHKDSTTQLTTKELIQTAEVLSRHLAQHHGIQIDFPSLETMLMNERTK